MSRSPKWSLSFWFCNYNFFCTFFIRRPTMSRSPKWSLSFWFCNYNFFVHFSFVAPRCLGPPSGLFPSGFVTTIFLVHFSFVAPRCIQYTCVIFHILFFNNVFCKAGIMKYLFSGLMYFSPWAFCCTYLKLLKSFNPPSPHLTFPLLAGQCRLRTCTWYCKPSVWNKVLILPELPPHRESFLLLSLSCSSQCSLSVFSSPISNCPSCFFTAFIFSLFSLLLASSCGFFSGWVTSLLNFPFPPPRPPPLLQLFQHLRKG